MIAEDIQVFFREFSTPVTATLSDGGSFSFRAIFDDADLIGKFGITEANLTQPRLTCAASDAVSLKRNTRVTVHEPGPGMPSRDFDVLESLPDGTGLTLVILAPVKPPSKEAEKLHAELLDADDT